jgi:cobalt/nickel transport system permease protein
MHVPDGMLPAQVCLAGYGGIAVLTWLSLDRIKRRGDSLEGIPRASVMAAAFFVASWIHIPIPPASVHFVLGGLMGVILGWYAFPAVLTGLFFQAVMFGHGGLTTLGVNGIVIGVPALLASALFSLRRPLGGGATATGILAFAAGAGSVVLSTLLMASLLMLTIPEHLPAQTEYQGIRVMALAYVPIAAIEGVFTALVVSFLSRVKPGMIGAVR